MHYYNNTVIKIILSRHSFIIKVINYTTSIKR